MRKVLQNEGIRYFGAQGADSRLDRNLNSALNIKGIEAHSFLVVKH